MITKSKFLQSIYDATWGRWVFAGAYDRFVRRSEEAGLADKRRELYSQARGRTLEIATGTGLGLAYYGDEVTELVLTEPYPHMVKALKSKVDDLRMPATIEVAYAEDLPFPDEHFDTVVASMILCSASKPEKVLNKSARVLKKGGQYLFLEHVRNPDPEIAKRQDRVQPGWFVFGNGCHCNRDTISEIKRSPLELDDITEDTIPEAWSILEAMIMGRAVRPMTAKAPNIEGEACCADESCNTQDAASQGV